MANQYYYPNQRYKLGDVFEIGRADWGRAVFVVVQVLSDNTQVLYRTNVGARDERDRWYEMGGQGKRGIRKVL